MDGRLKCTECGALYPEQHPFMLSGMDRCTGCIERGQLRAKVRYLHAEIDHMHQWVDDLQSGMYVNCVYCGHRYGPSDSTPTSMAEVLKKHVMQCPKHPMLELRAAVSVAIEEFQKVSNYRAIGRVKQALGEMLG